jgi:hypothetical protein
MRKYIYDPSLEGKHKAFDSKLYDKYDLPARDKIKEKLKDFVEDNPDKYQEDLIITDPACKYKFIELQVCAQWVNEKYPFEKVFIYERKAHFSPNTLFITFNKFLTKGYIFDAASFEGINPRRLKKYSREFVYDITLLNK